MSPPLCKDALARKSHSVGALLIIRNRFILRLSISFSLTSSLGPLPLFLFSTDWEKILHSWEQSLPALSGMDKTLSPPCLSAHPPPNRVFTSLGEGAGKQSSLPALDKEPLTMPLGMGIGWKEKGRREGGLETLAFNAEWNGIQVVLWRQTWASQRGSWMRMGILPM